MSVCCASSGPSSCKFQLMLAVRMASLPVVAEFLFLSTRHHDVQLTRYLESFPGSVFPNMRSATESGNLLYILWSPFTDKVYGGRTTCLIETHRQHFCRIADSDMSGQIPAYEVIRATAPQGIVAAASFFMLPVVEVPGGMPRAILADRVFLNGYTCKLNVPHVRKFLSLPGVVKPFTTSYTVRQGRKLPDGLTKPLPRRRCNFRQRKPLALPQDRTACNTYQRICFAMQFRGKDKTSKHGLRLLYVVRNPDLLRAVARFVYSNVSGTRRKLAMKHMHRSFRQLKMQLPPKSCTVELPWCVSEDNIPVTKHVLHDFVLDLFSCQHFQAGVFAHGKLKLSVRWKPTPNILQLIRTAPKFNRNLDSKSACDCVCSCAAFAGFPKTCGPDGSMHVCARQCELPWPAEVRILADVPVQTRIAPDCEWPRKHICDALCKLAAKIKDPYQTCATPDRIEGICKRFSERVITSWGLPAHHTSQHITMTHIRAVQNLCRGLCIDVLDKNPSSFSAVCPRLMREHAVRMFDFPTTHALVPGLTFILTEDIFTHTLVGTTQVLLTSGSEVCVDHTGTVCTTCKHAFPSRVFEGKVRCVGGSSFRYNMTDWLEVQNISLRGVADSLQPGLLNSDHREIVRKKLGQRQADWTPVRIIFKHKDLSKVRPLGDQSVSPTALLFRVIARCIELCLSALPVKSHFDRTSHEAVVQFLQQLRDDPLGDGQPLASLHNYAVFVLSRDVENGFMNVLHSEILDS